jgi:dephospho-CoA kinase
MKVAALVGMPGSGKSEVARVFQKHGYVRVRFGDVTDEEVKKRGLKLDEDNERLVREGLRKEHGMAAYAMLNLPRIEAALEKSNVVIDGLYSWEEYKYLKDRMGSRLHVVAVWSPPDARYARLRTRTVRPLGAGQARERDYAEIENVNKGGPIAMADYTIRNDSTLDRLTGQADDIVRDIG